MKKSPEKIAIIQVAIVAIVTSSFLLTITLTPTPSDYLPDRIARPDRKGMMYGYVFLDWDGLMGSGVEGEYMDLIAQCLDFCYVHAQWYRCALDNDTLNPSYLTNLTNFIAGLGSRGVKVVVHVWVSSYSPGWMHPYTPELIGKDDRWQGIDPDTENLTELQHRNYLKWSMVHFQELLCQYFIDENVSQHIMGFCLDDETQSEYWLDFFEELTDTIHSYNSSWETMAMFNRPDKYHMTGDSGMDVHAMDPYDQDVKFVEKITYAYQASGVEKVSVLIDAMKDHDDAEFNNKMRRQAWIAWFMGADSIGWYTFMYGDDQWACALNGFQSGLGPGITAKTNTTIETAIDIRKLNEAYDRIEMLDAFASDSMMSKMEEAYSKAKLNDFSGARQLVQEVIDG